MSNEKRLVFFFVLSLLSAMVIHRLMEATGLVPPPPPARNPALAKAEPKKEGAPRVPPDSEKAAEPKVAEKGADAAKDKDKLKPPPEPKVPLVKPEELVLGSIDDPNGYRLRAQLDQRGAGVWLLESSRYKAEFEEGKPANRPLQILRPDPLTPISLALTILPPKQFGVADDPAENAAAGLARVPAGERPLDLVVWEIVRDDKDRTVRPITKPGTDVEGQEAVFRTRMDDLDLSITKTFRLYKGEDGLEVALSFESPGKPQSVSYRILGPHGIPIEGEWYTGTFREAVFEMIDAGVPLAPVTLTASDVVKKKDTPDRFSKAPLRWTGVENQYFAAVFGPSPVPVDNALRWDEESSPIVLHENAENPQKADIGVEVLSKPMTIAPNAPVTHTYRVFAGPKTSEALTPFGAEDLATYRKSNWIPGASFLAKAVIAPMLDVTYNVTKSVAALFGGKRGNYGVAIILLTMLVRLAMFPLGRKQALAAKKMQDLQPFIKELQEKYKDDKEAQSRETFALWKKHGVNPVSGCLPALIQLPIFVGLWQALNNSVHLRHASFLYIRDLAAPDMLAKLPFEIPWLGHYLNALPFIVVALMLVQTKLFAPPATTPEQESQQQMMKVMMVFMAFMFYKVPSGLGLYFITSSLWQISERLLLPKVTHAPKLTPSTEDDKNPPGGGNAGGNGNGGGGRGGNGPAPVKPGRFAQFWEKVLAEAQKDQTHRNVDDDKSRDRDRERRDKTQPRARPGRRR
jgi:YidC/Oxa1 family membrane protein insertase